MRVLRLLACGLFVAGVCLVSLAQSTNTTVLGQWDFNSADLTTATTGSALQFVGGLQGTFETNQINGRPAGVMLLGAPASASQMLLAPFNPVANGGGTNLNQYTLIMDVMWPGQSDATWRALFNASTNNADDGEIFVNPDNQLGIYNDYALSLPANQWHRVILVYDLANTTNNLTRYLAGTNNVPAPQKLEESGLDSRFSLRGGLLLFSDNDGEVADVYVNSVQLRAGAMTESEVAALGPVSSGGIGQPSDPEQPVGDISITGIQRSGNNVVITLSAARLAQLQKKVRLADASWQLLETSATGTFTVPITDPTSFFRVELK